MKPVARVNADPHTVAGFGKEWSKFDQDELSGEELARLFDRYFHIFPWASVGADAVGFDAGCGSGRWARLVAPRVGGLLCVDASEEALRVAMQNLRHEAGCTGVHATVGALPFPDRCMDFGYSLGVLHHMPDTAAAIGECVRCLKPGAPFLLYLYYAFDNRPWWFRSIWKVSDRARSIVSRLPFGARYWCSQAIALAVYWPLARAARVAARAGCGVGGWPLSAYRDSSFYTMRTDALDRFGTRLEQRFTAAEIERMLTAAGLRDIRFSDSVPFWCVVGRRG